MATTLRRLTTKHPASRTTDPRCRGWKVRHFGLLRKGTCEAGNRAADEDNATVHLSATLTTGL
eukprot:1593973-Pyramimonas_sp.AAC.1